MSERELARVDDLDEKSDEVEQAVRDVQGPAVQELTGLVGQDRTPDLDAVVALFRQHPGERDALMTTVHRILGNTVAAQIAAALAPGAAAEGAQIDAAAGREPQVEVVATDEGVAVESTLEASAPAPIVVDEHLAPDAAVIQTDPVGTDAANDMREGGVAAVSEAPGVEERLGDVQLDESKVPPEPASGRIETTGMPIQMAPAEQVTFEAAAIVGRDATLTPYTSVETFREQIDELPISAEARNQVLGAYAEMTAGVAPAEATEAPVLEDEIRELI